MKTYQLVTPTETRLLTRREALAMEIIVIGGKPKISEAVEVKINLLVGELWDSIAPVREKPKTAAQILGDHFLVSGKINALIDWCDANSRFIRVMEE